MKMSLLRNDIGDVIQVALTAENEEEERDLFELAASLQRDREKGRHSYVSHNTAVLKSGTPVFPWQQECSGKMACIALLVVPAEQSRSNIPSV